MSSGGQSHIEGNKGKLPPGRIVELYGNDYRSAIDWSQHVEDAFCPYLQRTCVKTRKSRSDETIGTCTVFNGRDFTPAIICPHRFIDGHKVFVNCIHLLRLFEPGDDLRLFREVTIPGGGVDYVLAAVRRNKVVDFVGIELQAIDTTGNVWPARQTFLRSKGIRAPLADADQSKTFGMNWKMTAKTILLQLHHKIETFENVSKNLVLVCQDILLSYMEKEFSFGQFVKPLPENPLHIHAYELSQSPQAATLSLASRKSTDVAGVVAALGLQAEAKVELDEILRILNGKLEESQPLHLVS